MKIMMKRKSKVNVTIVMILALIILDVTGTVLYGLSTDSYLIKITCLFCLVFVPFLLLVLMVLLITKKWLRVESDIEENGFMKTLNFIWGFCCYYEYSAYHIKWAHNIIITFR